MALTLTTTCDAQALSMAMIDAKIINRKYVQRGIFFPTIISRRNINSRQNSRQKSKDTDLLSLYDIRAMIL